MPEGRKISINIFLLNGLVMKLLKGGRAVNLAIGILNGQDFFTQKHALSATGGDLAAGTGCPLVSGSIMIFRQPTLFRYGSTPLMTLKTDRREAPK